MFPRILAYYLECIFLYQCMFSVLMVVPKVVNWSASCGGMWFKLSTCKTEPMDQHRFIDHDRPPFLTLEYPGPRPWYTVISQAF